MNRKVAIGVMGIGLTFICLSAISSETHFSEIFYNFTFI